MKVLSPPERGTGRKERVLMRRSVVKQKLRADELVLVPKVCFMSPDIVEMLGLLGYDCVWICSEHRAIDASTLENMIRAGRAAGADCVIRLGVNGLDDIVRVLSAGAHGLMIPHVKTPAQAREIVAKAKYPPLGKRELENINADANYGLMPVEQYLQVANEESFIVVQIEDVEALDHIEDIAAVEGIDVIFVGPSDLALSLGLPGQEKHAKIVEIIQRVVKACESRDVVCGTPAIDSEHCKRLVGSGVRYFTDGSDWRAIRDAFIDAKQVYEQIGFGFRPEPD